MAVEKTVYSGKQWKVGILAESAFGTPQAASANFNRLPVESVNMPTLTVNERYGIRSGNTGLLEWDVDCFRTQKGGSVEWSFDMVLERQFLARFLACVLQDHSVTGSDPYVHTFTGSSSAALSRPGWGGLTAGIPATFTIAIEGPDANAGMRWGGNVLRELTITADPSSNEGRFAVSGTFYSGFSSTSGFFTEQNLSGTWVEPKTNYIFPTYSTKQMAVDGTALADMFIRSWDVTFSNGVERLGYDSNGDAESYKFATPGFEITGNCSVKYDGASDGTAGTNVLNHFLEKEVGASLKFEDQAGGVDADGEWSSIFNIYYTGQPELDLGGDEVFWNIPWRVVQPTNGTTGLPDGTAFEIVVCDTTAASAW